MFVVFFCLHAPPPSPATLFFFSSHGYLPRRESQHSLYSTGSVPISFSLFYFSFSSFNECFWILIWLLIQQELVKMLLENGQDHLFRDWPPPGVEDDHKKAFFDQVSFIPSIQLNRSATSFLHSLSKRRAFSLVDSTRFELPWRFGIIHQKR